MQFWVEKGAILCQEGVNAGSPSIESIKEIIQKKVVVVVHNATLIKRFGSLGGGWRKRVGRGVRCHCTRCIFFDVVVV